MKLTDLKLDGDLQSRVEISDEVINDYSEALREGAKFPPITVFHDGASYHVADGWQRYFAHKKAGLVNIEATIIEGTKRDAILFSLSANAKHGLRRTNADKRKAVMTMLDDMEWCEWADAEIARRCSVSTMTVGRIRKEIGAFVDSVKCLRKDKEVTMQRPDNQVKTKVEPKIEYEFDEKEEKIHEMATEIQSIAEENEVLKARVAVAAMEATDDEKQAAEILIADLQATVKAQDAEIKALKSSRDGFQNKCAEMMKQLSWYKKQHNKQAA
jgi:hypothetical protein